MTIVLPSCVVPRWKKCHQADSLLMWRSFAFLLSAEAKMASTEGNYLMCADLLTLFETAMQHVYRLSVPMEAAA